MFFWDLKARVYESARRVFPFNLILKREIDNIRTLINCIELDGKPMLDVGTGTGEVLRLLPHHPRIFALDRSWNMLQHAASKKQSCALVVADALAVPFKADAFSAITAVGIFEYTPDRLMFLRELRRVLSSSGLLVLTYSSPSLLNVFRMVLGHWIYSTDIHELSEFLERAGFMCKTHLRSRIQGQLLLKKKASEDE